MVELGCLSWRIPKKERNSYIYGVKIENDVDVERLILPIGHKDCWEGCAIVLSMQSDDILLHHLPRLFEWFMDLNWPGVDFIAQRVMKFPQEQIRKNLQKILVKAHEENDAEWIENLESVFGAILNETK